MMVDNEDLRLSLSLGCSSNTNFLDDDRNRNRNPSPNVNLMSSLLSTSSPAFNRNPWNHSFVSAGEPKSILKGIAVNRIGVVEEEEAGVSSPNSTISSVSGKRSEREAGAGDDLDIDRGFSRGISDEEDGETSRKKLRLSKEQSAVLEESFKEHSTLNPKQKSALANRLGLRPRQVEVWFQNRRARTKLKQTEVDCEFMKKYCEHLTEENKRLQKEVQELRALKMSPQFYMQMTPPTTLIMCPSCERVGAPAPVTGCKRARQLESEAIRP